MDKLYYGTDFVRDRLATVCRAFVTISTAKVLLHALARWSSNLGTVDNAAFA